MLERFLRYVRVDTQGAYRVAERPSTEKQLDLSRLLVEELREIGLADAELNEGFSVFATLPGTVDAPVVGLIAHVDTTPDVVGAGVSPVVHEAWDGVAITLPGDERQVLDPAILPALAARVGHDLVTSDGTTLLGADDKAGIAEIMAAVAYLARTGDDRPRAPIRVAFTVDEEVGRGRRTSTSTRSAPTSRTRSTARISASSRSRRSRRHRCASRSAASRCTRAPRRASS